MTTNSIDKLKLIVASDSQWSCDVDPDHIVFLRDYGFHKIAYRANSAMVCAGDGVLIGAWMNWYQAPVLDLNNMPAVNRLDGNVLHHVVFHIVMSTGEVFDPGIGMTLDYNNEARFAGSGKEHALSCYTTNKCVKTSVKTASSKDVYTGGSMMFVELGGNHNITPATRNAQQLNFDLGRMGQIMNKHTREVSSIGDYLTKRTGAATPNGLGTVNASAPTGAAPFEWSEPQKQELRKAFTMAAALETKAPND